MRLARWYLRHSWWVQLAALCLEGYAAIRAWHHTWWLFGFACASGGMMLTLTLLQRQIANVETTRQDWLANDPFADFTEEQIEAATAFMVEFARRQKLLEN